MVKLEDMFLKGIVEFYKDEEEYRADKTAVSAHFLMGLEDNDIYGLRKEIKALYYSPFVIGHLVEEFLFEPEKIAEYKVIDEIEAMSPKATELADLVIAELVTEFTTEDYIEIADRLAEENKFWGNWSLPKKREQYDTQTFRNYIDFNLQKDKMVTRADYQIAKDSADKINENMLYKSLKDQKYSLYYHPRLKIKKLYSFDLKCELDLLAVKWVNGKMVDVKIIDFKSMSDSVTKFIDKSYIKYRLFIQSGLYTYLIRQILKTQLSPSLVSFYFIVVSKTHRNEPAVQFLDENIMLTYKGISTPKLQYRGLYAQLKEIEQLYAEGIDVEFIYNTATTPLALLGYLDGKDLVIKF